jgi:hypothetical protein
VRQEVLRALGHGAEPTDPLDVARLEAAVTEVVTADPKVGALAGGAGGLLGLPALPVEIPIVVGLALRAAHRVAAGFGLSVTEPAGMALPLHALDLALGGDLPGSVVRAVAFATGGAVGGAPASGREPHAPEQKDEIVLEVLAEPPAGTPLVATPLAPSSALVAAPLAGVAGAGLVEGLRVLARGADPLAYVQIRVTVQRLAVRLAARKLAGAVPLLGAAVGGALGYGLVERVRKSARTLAALRLLSIR